MSDLKAGHRETARKWFYTRSNTYFFQSSETRVQTGQSMLLGIVLCGVGVLAWLLMLELGQRVHDISSLHRGADAASYSAAILQARALNMHAYINRAQLAHQIAIAHIIGAATATQYRSKLGQQAQRRNPPPSLIGAFFGPQHSAAYMAALAGGLGDHVSQQTFRQAFIRHERVVHHVLGRVRTQQIQQLEQQRQEAIERILVRNIGHSGSAMRGDSLKELGLSIQMTLDESKDFVVQHSANDATWRNFLTALVGQYGFLDERDKTHRNFWLVNARCPHKRHELRRRGRLELSAEGQWHSEETLSFHALRHNKLIGCYHREYPMGWAVLATQKDQLTNSESSGAPIDFNRRPFWRWARAQSGSMWNIFSGRENPLAKSFGTSAAVRWPSKGLGQYAQIAKGRQHEPIRFGLRVQQRLNDDAVITSDSTAQTYFEAPLDRSTSKYSPNRGMRRQPVEAASGSLFAPYWRATLVPNQQVTSAMDRRSKSMMHDSDR